MIIHSPAVQFYALTNADHTSQPAFPPHMPSSSAAVRYLWSSQWKPGKTTSVMRHPVESNCAASDSAASARVLLISNNGARRVNERHARARDISSSSSLDFFQTFDPTRSCSFSPAATFVPITYKATRRVILDAYIARQMVGRAHGPRCGAGSRGR